MGISGECLWLELQIEIREKKGKKISVTMLYYRNRINEISVYVWKKHIVIHEGTLQSTAITLWLP